MAAMETYLTCIEQDEKATVAAMTEITDEERASRDVALTKKYNAAIEEMELLAARFTTKKFALTRLSPNRSPGAAATAGRSLA